MLTSFLWIQSFQSQNRKDKDKNGLDELNSAPTITTAATHFCLIHWKYTWHGTFTLYPATWFIEMLWVQPLHIIVQVIVFSFVIIFSLSCRRESKKFDVKDQKLLLKFTEWCAWCNLWFEYPGRVRGLGMGVVPTVAFKKTSARVRRAYVGSSSTSAPTPEWQEEDDEYEITIKCIT